MGRPLQHFSHDHILVPFIGWDSTGFSCGICNHHHADIPGEDGGYGCVKCRYFINKACADLPQRIEDHPLHRGHLLTLAKRSFLGKTNTTTTSSGFCYYCEKTFENDQYTYGCEQCALYMHMRCAIIPLPTIKKRDDGDGEGRVQFLCHGDSMGPANDVDIKGKVAYKSCFACQSGWSGPSYCCSDEKCDNFLHQSCADKLPHEIPRHPFHPRHPLALQVSKPRACLSCCKKDCRLVFGCCEEGCDFHLGTECAFLETSVRCRSHDHDLYLIKEASCDIHCYACQKSYNKWPDRDVIPDEVNRTRSFQFRCLECDFNLHFLCGPLPVRVKYEYHVDVLTLVDHSVTEGHSDEHYCDACEEEIKDPQFRVYYCQDCKYVAHIHCVFSEIINIFKKHTTKYKKLMSLGEGRWESSIELLDEKADDVGEPTQKNGETKELTTLKDIYESLTKEEKDKLADPFGFDRPSHSVYRQNTYKFCREQNSARFDRRASIFDDIDVVQRLLNFNSDNDFDYFLNEFCNYTPAENLKLDEGFLRQHVEDVKGYKVPKTLTHILDALLRNRGDLGGYRGLTPGLKSVGATFICIVIEKMCRIRAEDITKDDLANWYFCLEAIRKITGLEIIELDSFPRFVVPIFLGFEAKRLRHEVNEALDQKIAALKDELKRCEESRERLQTHASETVASSFMKDCLSKASDWKRKFLGDKWF